MTKYDERLRELRKLKPNWDSYGADPTDPEVIRAVTVFLRAVERGDMEIVPESDGGIQVECHVDGWDIEVEFRPGRIVDTTEPAHEVVGFAERAS